jgi:hypothetical protein
MSTFNIDELNKAVSSISYSPWESADLDKFMENHSDIKKIMLATPDSRLKDIDFIPTKYGMLKVSYSPYLPPDTMYLMRQPNFMYDPLKPSWL